MCQLYSIGNAPRLRLFQRKVKVSSWSVDCKIHMGNVAWNVNYELGLFFFSLKSSSLSLFDCLSSVRSSMYSSGEGLPPQLIHEQGE